MAICTYKTKTLVGPKLPPEYGIGYDDTDGTIIVTGGSSVLAKLSRDCSLELAKQILTMESPEFKSNRRFWK